MQCLELSRRVRPWLSLEELCHQGMWDFQAARVQVAYKAQVDTRVQVQHRFQQLGKDLGLHRDLLTQRASRKLLLT